MNEVEKMYKLANIAKPVIKKWYYDGYYEDFSWESSEEDCTELLKYFDNSIDKLNDRIQQMKKEENAKYDRYTDSVDTEFGRIEKAYIDYPPFTAEKQLELIKWLGELDMLEIMRTTREDKAWIIDTEYGMSGNVYKYSSRKLSFADTLANLINELWQDLTEADKAQIKDILSE